MTLGLRPEPAGIIDMIPSLPIHTSVLIPLIVGLFLAALILRAQRLPSRPLPQNGLTARRARMARRRVQRSRRLRGVGTANRGTQMSTTVRTEMKQNDAQGSFRIYWGRTAFALLGLLALFGGLATAIAVPFVASLTWIVPAICAGVLVVSVVCLQVMAVVRRRKNRRRRVERAMQDAMDARPEDDDAELAQRQQSAAAAAAELGISSRPAEGTRAQRPFDVMGTDRTGKGGPDSLLSLDEDGLPTTAERLFDHGGRAAEPAVFDQSQTPHSGEPTVEEPWDPREVPSAKYMVAEKVQRPDPEPLGEQKPAPSGEVKLNQQAGAPQSPEQAEQNVASQQSMNLDSVLRRRRA